MMMKMKKTMRRTPSKNKIGTRPFLTQHLMNRKKRLQNELGVNQPPILMKMKVSTGVHKKARRKRLTLTPMTTINAMATQTELV